MAVREISGADRIRTCGPGFPSHRFSKPALSATQPPLLEREIVHYSTRLRNPRQDSLTRLFTP